MNLPTPTEVQREAAAWVARLKSPQASEQDNLELVTWLKRSPEHVRHYLELVSLDVELSDPGLYEGMSLDVPGRALESNVLPLNASPAQAEAMFKPRAHRRRRWWAGAAAAAVLVIATVSMLALMPDHYRSGIGELRSIVLDDGSVVTLNTQSQINVRYSEEQRMIELIRGEALFRVAKQHNRPFSVSVAGTVVEALGTAFNIYKRPAGALVTVVEGRVAVRAPQAAGSELGAGEQIAIAPEGKVRQLDPHEIARVTTWTQRRLSFDQTPVSEVVAELNRYNREQLTVDDPALASRPVTGAFEANDPESFILFLQREAGVTVREGSDGVRLLEAVRERR